MTCSHSLAEREAACYTEALCPICLDDALRMERLQFSAQQVEMNREVKKIYDSSELAKMHRKNYLLRRELRRLNKAHAVLWKVVGSIRA